MRKYDINNLGTFEEEWLPHSDTREWWYCTGILNDQEDNLYSYQFTLLRVQLGPIVPKVLMLALTDYSANRHYYLQQPRLSSRGIVTTRDKLAFDDQAIVIRNEKGFALTANHKDFSLTLQLDYGKGAVWHCDDGRLQMGATGDKETTLYYSYPNMTTTGQLKLNNAVAKEVLGSSWFDRQGGSYSIHKAESQWEWFSLRFFDQEEIMLFTFPNVAMQDGTYIFKDGTRQRLQEYTVTITDTTKTEDGMVFSAGWDLVMPGIKEEVYTIEPIQEGHINFAYFEELCVIKNKAGEEKGYCFAELLPAIHNDYHALHVGRMLRRIER